MTKKASTQINDVEHPPIPEEPIERRHVPPEQWPDDEIAAMVVRAISDRMDQIETIREERSLLQQQELDAVISLRKLKVSWAKIGDALGITPQAAQQRFGEHDPRQKRK